MNAGNSNTGFADAGNVNTGAFITGNDNNGILWRGNFEGLAGFSLGYAIPQFAAIGADVNGGVGPITVIPPIHIPSIPLFLNTAGGIGPISIPSVPIPSIHLGISPTFDVGPSTVAPITLSIPGFSLDAAISAINLTSGSSSGFQVKASYIPFFGFGPGFDPGGGVSVLQPFTVGPISFGPTTLTLPGFTIPTGPIHIGLPVSPTIPGIQPPGRRYPATSAGLRVVRWNPGLRHPDRCHRQDPAGPACHEHRRPHQHPDLQLRGNPGLRKHDQPAVLGLLQLRGGGSGLQNFGSSMSGWFNAMSDPLLGSAAGYFDYGTLLSGLLNRGAGLSGVYNLGALGLTAQSIVSGFNNFGRQLSGLLFAGTGP